MKRTVLYLMLLTIAVAGCGNYKMFGTDEHIDEDWTKYDYVFAGDSPDPIGDPMYIKINVNEDGTVTGRTLGVLFAEFTGTLAENGDLEFTMTYLDHQCEANAEAVFVGTMTDDTITGLLQVWSCEWWSFEYLGELVGGALAE